ncbi:MAG TPA: efflux RND transporter periplasmic adaptor subunit [Steroidobacteraceae bacterium]|nr:efflux RND transporter periplasmic adaptor subunit [Steroidobacteraceae bacterium]
MRYPRAKGKWEVSAAGRTACLAAAIGTAYAIASVVLGLSAEPASAAGRASSSSSQPRLDTDIVKLSDSQLHSISVERVADHEFLLEKTAVGIIDFDENMSLQVFSPYQGRIIQALVDLGDEVKKNQILFTVESPDFIAAQSSLISAAATLDQTASALARAKVLYAAKGIDQNDYETAVANQQSAEGALKAARRAVAVFGRSEDEIDRIVEKRQVDPALLIKSPISGRITARNAAPGLLVQPGTAPAPYSVADVSTMWMLANVPEADAADIRLGQSVTADVMALPGRVFAGKVTAIAAVVDPNSRRVTVRAEIKDPNHELRSDMFATFSIRTGAPRHALGVPLNGVVREGDGTFSVWVVGSDPHVFTRHIVRIGLQQNGYDEILEGLHPGESVAVNGAIFLSNILYGGAT